MRRKHVDTVTISVADIGNVRRMFVISTSGWIPLFTPEGVKPLGSYRSAMKLRCKIVAIEGMLWLLSMTLGSRAKEKLKFN